MINRKKYYKETELLKNTSKAIYHLVYEINNNM